MAKRKWPPVTSRRSASGVGTWEGEIELDCIAGLSVGEGARSRQ